jgi:hypothetical protein
MTVETVTYIGDLDDDNPAEGETGTLHEGNDHIRNIKTALLNTLGAPEAKAYTLAKITTYSSGSGTFTPTDGVSALYVECYGGGGSGGSTDSSYWGIAGPGGGGAYCAKWVTTVAASYAYAVGAGGAAETVDGAYGNPGGQTTFAGGAVSLAAPGGFGGTHNFTGTAFYALGLGAGVATGGDINLAGGASEYANGNVIGGTEYIFGYPKSGDAAGPCGGKGVTCVTDTNATAGTAPGGGGGSAYAATAAQYDGGAGAAGMIRVWEYY